MRHTGGYILEGYFEARTKQFADTGRDDSKWITSLLFGLSWKLRGRTELPWDHPEYLNQTSFKTYFKPMRKLLEMNDVMVNWKRIHMTFLECTNILDTREVDPAGDIIHAGICPGSGRSATVDVHGCHTAVLGPYIAGCRSPGRRE